MKQMTLETLRRKLDETFQGSCNEADEPRNIEKKT